MDDPLRYTIGWIAQTPREFEAALAILDEDYGPIYLQEHICHGGRVAHHNVVFALQNHAGNDATKYVYDKIRYRFSSIKHTLSVGTASGVPKYDSAGTEIQMVLGDIVVASNGVFFRNLEEAIEECDNNKATNDEPRDEDLEHQDEGMEEKNDVINRKGQDEDMEDGDRTRRMVESKSKKEVPKHTEPPKKLLSFVETLRSQHGGPHSPEISMVLQLMRERIGEPERPKLEDPGPDHDMLFHDDLLHTDASAYTDCELYCNLRQSRKRQHRGASAERLQDTPKIHYGTLFLANRIPSSAIERDKIHNNFGNICFDIFHSLYPGLLENTFSGCLAIRGICDYADSHTNPKWKPYAAATATAFSKELLEILPVTSTSSSPPPTKPAIMKRPLGYARGACHYCGLLVDNDGLSIQYSHTVSLEVLQFSSKRRSCPTRGCQVLVNLAQTMFQATMFDRITYFVQGYQDGRSLFVSSNTEFCAIDLFVTDGPTHPIWTAIPHFEVHSDLSSDSSLQFVKRMLEDCKLNHDACSSNKQQDKEPFMPKRVLDLGPDCYELQEKFPVRLLETAQLSHFEPYAALSHRWCTAGSFATTRSDNITDHEAQIPFQTLGVVFQDTILLLRRLGIRYVWIDSLCIIQDSLEDWRDQSKMMAEIYGRAYFTIARQSTSDRPKSIRCLDSQVFQLADIPQQSRSSHVSRPRTHGTNFQIGKHIFHCLKGAGYTKNDYSRVGPCTCLIKNYHGIAVRPGLVNVDHVANINIGMQNSPRMSILGGYSNILRVNSKKSPQVQYGNCGNLWCSNIQDWN
ncbi:hypothetical protein CC80DRAFT_75006 [Byssothecium circinans]|uniref:Heterokaryon incompatibility domain-containing protein n=1 Tax=Byssothecium circinans TaxID=147558 RepID=A0A6A5TWD2_9PLEO|nr:hypothetical protein CC80DRAFT_75006 [Byssothecium circinans]